MIQALHSPFSILHSKHGQAVLALTLIIGGIIVSVALTLAVLAISFIDSAYGFSISGRAEAVASAGAADGLMHLLREKSYSGTYNIGVGNDTASVTVTQNSPVSGEVTITSSATILLRQRTTTIVVTRNSASGLITVISKIQS